MNAAFAHDSGLFHFEEFVSVPPIRLRRGHYQFPCAEQARQERSKRSERSLGTALRSAGTEVPLASTASISLPPTHRFHGLVGATAAMRQLYQRIEAAAATKSNLLIVGESGTGIELVARAIHECGPRRERPFVALNCAALPQDLIESELFGFKRGAFSGATVEHLGLFRAAEGGTLLLDEITEMSAETQSKLLRAIQERAIRPIGSIREEPVDVRVLSSTNRDPRRAVAEGDLREDLYYRLQACLLTLPPLRDRREDIPLLVDHFIAVFNEELGRNFEGIEPQALDAMLKHPWPGNVHELCSAIEGAFTSGAGPLIKLSDLPPAVVRSRA
jgi:transcriptional regulator with PAS, ATPase and Fis domain